MTPEIAPKKGIPAAVKGLAATTVLTVAAVGGAAGLGAFNRGETKPDATPTPSAAAASPTPERTPAATPTFTPTPEPTQIEKTPTPEIECNVLSKELCSSGIYIQVRNENGTTNHYIAFEDLPNGTPLFSLINGERTTAQIPAGSSETSLQGSVLSTFPTDRSFNYIYIGDFKWSNNTEIKSGETVGTISNSGVKSLGKYELLITASKRNSSGTLESDKEALQKLFPKAFETEPLTFSRNSSGTIITSPRYEGESK